jgi:hypothetical protein
LGWPNLDPSPAASKTPATVVRTASKRTGYRADRTAQSMRGTAVVSRGNDLGTVRA